MKNVQRTFISIVNRQSNHPGEMKDEVCSPGGTTIVVHNI
ncbi:pyrroline-5-carboxylate reductase dimerization domain-containing protein [Anaerosporobacter sp.]